jgi:cytochrome c oxidase subunit 4
MGYGWLNLASLVLGITAWVLPVVNLIKRNNPNNKNWVAFTVTSFSACAIALFFQIVYQDYLARKEDWSAIMDTSSALVKVSAVLLIVTLVLNVVAVVAYNKRGNKHTA